MILRLPLYPHPQDPCLVVVSFDPGGTCGWAVHKVGREALEIGGWTFARVGHLSWAYGEFKDRSEAYMVDQMIELTREAWAECDFEGGDVLAAVVESFQLRMFSQDDNLLSPVRVRAMYDYGMRGAGVPIFYQTPADAMRTVTDERLNLWNLWREHPGMTKDELEHRRDAQRHGILFARKYASDRKIRDKVARAKVNSSEE